jgi:hypothetical protein
MTSKQARFLDLAGEVKDMIPLFSNDEKEIVEEFIAFLKMKAREHEQI